MINDSKSTIADVIQDLEEVLKGTKEKEQSLRLQKAINTLDEAKLVTGTELVIDGGLS